jgi:hypothetical protein
MQLLKDFMLRFIGSRSMKCSLIFERDVQGLCSYPLRDMVFKAAREWLQW